MRREDVAYFELFHDNGWSDSWDVHLQIGVQLVDIVRRLLGLPMQCLDGSSDMVIKSRKSATGGGLQPWSAFGFLANEYITDRRSVTGPLYEALDSSWLLLRRVYRGKALQQRGLTGTYLNHGSTCSARDLVKFPCSCRFVCRRMLRIGRYALVYLVLTAEGLWVVP